MGSPRHERRPWWEYGSEGSEGSLRFHEARENALAQNRASLHAQMLHLDERAAVRREQVLAAERAARKKALEEAALAADTEEASWGLTHVSQPQQLQHREVWSRAKLGMTAMTRLARAGARHASNDGSAALLQTSQSLPSISRDASTSTRQAASMAAKARPATSGVGVHRRRMERGSAADATEARTLPSCRTQKEVKEQLVGFTALEGTKADAEAVRGPRGSKAATAARAKRRRDSLESRVRTASSTFSAQHWKSYQRGHGALLGLAADSDSGLSQADFSIALGDMSRGRAFLPPAPPEGDGGLPWRRHKDAPLVPTKRPFDVLRSIWGPRVQWSDAKDLYDTEEVEIARFHKDWARCVQIGVVKTILARDDDHGGGDDDGDGLPDEVEEVMAVLWDHHDVIQQLYVYYTCLGDTIDSLGFNQWSAFVSDFGLAKRSFKYCKKADADRLFIAVNAADTFSLRRAKEEERERWTIKKASTTARDDQKGFSRAEWLVALINLAIYRYVLPGEEVDVSEALSKLITNLLLPKVDYSICSDPNDFRQQKCYTEETTTALEKHAASLTHIFSALASSGRSGPGEGAGARKLVGLSEWLAFMRGLHLIGEDLTERDATLCFVFSRMIVIDGSTDKGHARESSLPFEGFLEALCRVAQMKAFPTDGEITSADQPDAGSYLTWLIETDVDAYEQLIDTRSTPWGGTPPQPHHRCVAHLLSVVLRTVEAGSRGSDDLSVTQREVSDWMAKAMARTSK